MHTLRQKRAKYLHTAVWLSKRNYPPPLRPGNDIFTFILCVRFATLQVYNVKVFAIAAHCVLHYLLLCSLVSLVPCVCLELCKHST
jgi:hypothetical protein